LYFSIPKIDLILLPGLASGVRIQDFIVLFVFFYVFQSRVWLRYQVELFLFTVFCFVLCLTSYVTKLSNLVFYLRYVEYFVLSLAIYLLLQTRGTDVVIRLFLSILLFGLLFSFLQYLELLPSFDTGRGMLYGSGRNSGTAGNALEYSYFLITLFYLFLSMVKDKVFLFITFSLVVLGLLFSGSRSPILFLFVSVFFILGKKFSLYFLFFCVLFVILLVLAYLDGFISLFSLFLFWEGYLVDVCLSYDVFDFNEIKSGTLDAGLDRSFAARVLKICSAFSFASNSGYESIFGFGALALGGAMDSGVIRIFLEFGIFGIVFLLFFCMKGTFLAYTFLSINIFFDGYLNSMCMPVLLFLILQQERHRSLKTF